MAVSTARPSVTPLVSWDKAQQQVKPSPKKSNPMLMAIMVAIILLAAAGLWRTFNRPAAGQWVQVMVAKSDVQAGSRLGITNLTFLDVPKQFASPEMIISLNDVTGRVARTFIPAGEPIKMDMLFNGNGGLSTSLETHERAITLRLEDDALVDHAIMPEDRVDILAISNKNDKKFTKTICQAVRVLMTSPKEQVSGRHAGSTGNKITLAVTPDLAEIVNEAADIGKIRLVLRSRLSRIEQKLAGADPDNLLPASALSEYKDIHTMEVKAELQPLPPPPVALEMPAAQAPGPMQWMVEVISGSHRETYAVPEK